MSKRTFSSGWNVASQDPRPSCGRSGAGGAVITHSHVVRTVAEILTGWQLPRGWQVACAGAEGGGRSWWLERDVFLCQMSWSIYIFDVLTTLTPGMSFVYTQNCRGFSEASPEGHANQKTAGMLTASSKYLAPSGWWPSQGRACQPFVRFVNFAFLFSLPAVCSA